VGYRFELWRHGFIGTAEASPLLAARRRILALLQTRPLKETIMTRFTNDNTEGYAPSDLRALNTAWNSLPCVVLDEDADIGAKSMLDHVSEQLLYSYDRGLRGEALVAFYYRAGAGI
jgi:hypothetical protein